jgi:hypothetical protein
MGANFTSPINAFLSSPFFAGPLSFHHGPFRDRMRPPTALYKSHALLPMTTSTSTAVHSHFSKHTRLRNLTSGSRSKQPSTTMPPHSAAVAKKPSHSGSAARSGSSHARAATHSTSKSSSGGSSSSKRPRSHGSLGSTVTASSGTKPSSSHKSSASNKDAREAHNENLRRDGEKKELRERRERESKVREKKAELRKAALHKRPPAPTPTRGGRLRSEQESKRSRSNSARNGGQSFINSCSFSF